MDSTASVEMGWSRPIRRCAPRTRHSPHDGVGTYTRSDARPAHRVERTRDTAVGRCNRWDSGPDIRGLVAGPPTHEPFALVAFARRQHSRTVTLSYEAGARTVVVRVHPELIREGRYTSQCSVIRVAFPVAVTETVRSRALG